MGDPEDIIRHARWLNRAKPRDPHAAAALQGQIIDLLIDAAGHQDARIAALEAARAPHGPPLEGTGERKGEQP